MVLQEDLMKFVPLEVDCADVAVLKMQSKEKSRETRRAFAMLMVIKMAGFGFWLG